MTGTGSDRSGAPTKSSSAFPRARFLHFHHSPAPTVNVVGASTLRIRLGCVVTARAARRTRNS